MTSHLFETPPPAESWPERLGPGAVLLHGFALPEAPALIAEVARIAASAPFRQMITPSGHRMSVAMTNCGALGGGCRIGPVTAMRLWTPRPVNPGHRYPIAFYGWPRTQRPRPGLPAFSRMPV